MGLIGIPTRLDLVDARAFGTVQAGGSVDCLPAFQAALTYADANGRELYIPKGRFKIGSPGLKSLSYTPRIRGAGSDTVLVTEGTTYNALELGPGIGDLGGEVGPAGWVRDLKLEGPDTGSAPSGYNAGIVCKGVTFTEFRNVWADYFPVAWDFLNNNYGSSFYNCRFGSFSRSRIGCRLSGDRTGMAFASGNDLPFYNCWFSGRDAAIWAERGGGGYSIFGGQVGSGGALAAPDDDLGSLVINKNLEEGTTGGRMSMRFFGTSFEAVHRAWNVRIHNLASNPNGVQLLFHGVGFTGRTLGIGVLKLTGGYNDVIVFNSVGLNGAYSNARPLEINTHAGAGRASFVEFGTQTYGATFNSVALDLNSTGMLLQSRNPRSFAITPFHVYIPGDLALTAVDVGSGAQAFSKSTNGGSSWSLV